MTTEGNPTPAPPRRARFPIFGCVALVILVALAAALAVGGSFWGWVTVATLTIVGGIAVVVVLTRQNRRGGGLR